MSDRPPDSQSSRGVAADRGTPLIRRTLSLQARFSSQVTAGLMIAFGAAILLWYYGHQFARQRQASDARRNDMGAEAKTEMTLPPLGPVRAPLEARMVGLATNVADPKAADPNTQTPGLQNQAATPTMDSAGIPTLLQQAPSAMGASGGKHPAVVVGEQSSHRDRRYQGDVYAEQPIWRRPVAQLHSNHRCHRTVEKFKQRHPVGLPLPLQNHISLDARRIDPCCCRKVRLSTARSKPPSTRRFRG